MISRRLYGYFKDFSNEINSHIYSDTAIIQVYYAYTDIKPLIKYYGIT